MLLHWEEPGEDRDRGKDRAYNRHRELALLLQAGQEEPEVRSLRHWHPWGMAVVRKSKGDRGRGSPVLQLLHQQCHHRMEAGHRGAGHSLAVGNPERHSHRREQLVLEGWC